ncbi:CBS domain-containing protein [Syntrophomonas palmitatica]|mgnify:CR=1 FL=1|uniref:CBS domain-containing protein n=1 Tax=Syntrophomonas palmitatica TaxID=402877 RepID=UPI0006D18058|nr:CBS domain-containing protein [Syntrophomonas palmitatica]
MLARDIMTREVITAHPEEKIEEVTRLMLENKISGIPVVNQQGHVLGIITEKDLMIKASELKVPFYVTLFDSIIFLENPLRFNNDLKKYTASRVKDVMNTKIQAVEEDTPVSKIVELMQSRGINRVPVLRNGKLVGIITRNDILKSLVKTNG